MFHGVLPFLQTQQAGLTMGADAPETHDGGVWVCVCVKCSVKLRFNANHSQHLPRLFAEGFAKS